MGINKDQNVAFGKSCTVISCSRYSEAFSRIEQANAWIVLLLNKFCTAIGRAIVHNDDLVCTGNCLLYAFDRHGEILSFVDRWNDQTYLFIHRNLLPHTDKIAESSNSCCLLLRTVAT